MFLNQKNKKQNQKQINKYKILFFVILSLFVGFLIAYFKNYKGRKNKENLQELILLLKIDCYHIHHFILLGVIIIMMIISRHLSTEMFYILVFFMIGYSLEDLLFTPLEI